MEWTHRARRNIQNIFWLSFYIEWLGRSGGSLFRLLEGAVSKRQIKLIRVIIRLFLTIYAWEDDSSICGAFYNGLYYLGEVL